MTAIHEIFNKHELPTGNLLGSKSGYRSRHPENNIIFNASIFTPKKKESIWWGDLDVTLNCKKLQEICNEIGDEIIITFEGIGWYAEDKKYKEIVEHAHTKFKPNSNTYFVRKYDGMHCVTAGNITIMTGKGVDWIEEKI